MSDGDVDIRLLALRRQQKRSQSRATVDQLLDDEPTHNGRIRSSGRSAYEATPVKAYIPEVRSSSTNRNSYLSSMPVPIFDEDTRIGRMHVPPVVRCECNGHEAFALISSSETVSTISIDMVQKMKLLDHIIPEPSHVYNPLALHHPVLKGKVKYIDFSIGSWQQVAQFNVVENSVADITLGIDFLRRTQSHVNFEDCVLMVGGNKGERIAFLNTRDIITMSRKNSYKPNFSSSIMD